MSVRTIGLMSGTSIDGIDAAIVRFDGGAAMLDWEIEAFRSVAYSAGQRNAIRQAIETGDAAMLCEINASLGEWFAEAVLALCGEAGIATEDVAAIGSHGHTIWHRPPASGVRGATLQLGCAATIAERTGIDVISDFRSRDVAAGGHGAPLVPFADRLLFAANDAIRVLVNIGGVANLTRVPPRGSDDALLAFDTGPGNALIDAAVEIATSGEDAYDADGERAARGAVDEVLLAGMLEDPFLALEPPRSTGREHFGRAYVDRIVSGNTPATADEWDDLIATMTELTARTIADAMHRFIMPLAVDEVIITGGGARNAHLVRRIAALITPVPVVPGSAAGIDSDAKEAVAFAALAWAHIEGIPGNVPAATGASGPRILGSRTPGRFGEGGR